MPTQWRGWKPRNVAFFVSVIVVVAVAVVMAGRELGVGRQAEAVQTGAAEQGETANQGAESDLSLTLTRQRAVCETDQNTWEQMVDDDRFVGHGVCETDQNTWEQMGNYARLNDDGEVETGIISHGFRAENFMPVDWKISGGTAPYELVIDGMDRNWDGAAFEGNEGNAWVDCLWPTSPAEYFGSGPARYTRRYRSEPQIDSGWKRFSAQVTDANGNVARADAEFYILTTVWADGHTITPGETYRLKSTIDGPGFTFTAPANMPMSIGHYATSNRNDGCSEHVAFRVGDPRVGATLYLCSHTGTGAIRHLPDGSRSSQGEAVTGFYAEHPLNQALSDIVDSIGAYPVGTSE